MKLCVFRNHRCIHLLTFALTLQVSPLSASKYRTFDLKPTVKYNGQKDFQLFPETSRRNLHFFNKRSSFQNVANSGLESYVTLDKDADEHTVTINLPHFDSPNNLFKKFVLQPVIQYVVQYNKNLTSSRESGKDVASNDYIQPTQHLEGSERRRRDQWGNYDSQFNDEESVLKKSWEIGAPEHNPVYKDLDSTIWSHMENNYEQPLKGSYLSKDMYGTQTPTTNSGFQDEYRSRTYQPFGSHVTPSSDWPRHPSSYIPTPFPVSGRRDLSEMNMGPRNSFVMPQNVQLAGMNQPTYTEMGFSASPQFQPTSQLPTPLPNRAPQNQIGPYMAGPKMMPIMTMPIIQPIVQRTHYNPPQSMSSPFMKPMPLLKPIMPTVSTEQKTIPMSLQNGLVHSLSYTFTPNMPMMSQMTNSGVNMENTGVSLGANVSSTMGIANSNSLIMPGYLQNLIPMSIMTNPIPMNISNSLLSQLVTGIATNSSKASDSETKEDARQKESRPEDKEMDKPTGSTRDLRRGRGRGRSFFFSQLRSLPRLPSNFGGHLSFLISTRFGSGSGRKGANEKSEMEMNNLAIMLREQLPLRDTTASRKNKQRTQDW